MGHTLLLLSTCDIGENMDRDMWHCHFLKSTCDIGDPLSLAPALFHTLWPYLFYYPNLPCRCFLFRVANLQRGVRNINDTTDIGLGGQGATLRWLSAVLLLCFIFNRKLWEVHILVLRGSFRHEIILGTFYLWIGRLTRNCSSNV